ncbi:transcription initiation factor TFIID subunit 4-like [Triticum aestivum]|uniref:transcription initiation factor TFIID subunit 4-like n=1 Tax=Triticum aestivum TaxID=4565 RepID=UPI001D02D0A0|nr:transcription initiation factor TFIID subunit 4-like [Triticum aestivum]
MPPSARWLDCHGVRLLVTGIGRPVTVARATAVLVGRYVLCSSAHLLQPGRALFRPDDVLQPGTVYFLPPHSIFQAESSAVASNSRARAPSTRSCPATPSAAPAPRPRARPQSRPAPPPRAAPLVESMGRSSMQSASTMRHATVRTLA